MTFNAMNALVSSEQMYVLGRRLKQSGLMVGSRMKPGREFQTVGPASEKARRPLSVELVARYYCK